MLAHIGIALVSFFAGLLFGCGIGAICNVAHGADVCMRIERGKPDPLPRELIADYETNTEAILYSELIRE